MNLLRFRPLCVFIACFFLALRLSADFCLVTKWICIAVFFVLSLFSFLFALFSHRSKIYFLSFLFFFILLGLLISAVSFSKTEKITSSYGETPHTFYATVTAKNSEKSYLVKTSFVDENEEEINLLLHTQKPLQEGNQIAFQTEIFALENSSFGFDEKQYYRTKKVELETDFLTEIEVLDATEREKTIFEKTSLFLQNRLQNCLSEESFSIATAILLGNREFLDQSVSLDFSRLGISHILALSGLHISLLISLVGFVLYRLKLRKWKKNLLLVFGTAFFIALTGFSYSAIRAGLMMCFCVFSSSLRRENDSVTSLFLAVFLICTIEPYSVFSVGLWLSFFAVLGCLFTERLIIKSKKLSNISSKIGQFFVFSVLTTFIVSVFTLPIAFHTFQSISVASLLLNLLMIPAFSLVLYLLPILLLFATVPYVNFVLSSAVDGLIRLLLKIARFCADFSFVSVPLYHPAQKVFLVILCLALLSLFFVSFRRRKKAFFSVLTSFVVFFSVTVIILTVRQNQQKIHCFSDGENDYIAYEEDGCLTVFAPCKSQFYAYRQIAYFAKEIGYTEIENLVVFNEDDIVLAEELQKNILIRHILPASQNGEFSTEKAQLSIDCYGKIPSIIISSDQTTVTYFGKGIYDIPTRKTEYLAQNSQAVIFGCYGKKPAVPYTYSVEHVQYLVFLHGSEEYAEESFLKANESKTVRAENVVSFRFR